MPRSRLASLPALAVFAILVAACGGSGSSPAPASAAGSDTASAEASIAAARIQVALTDALKIEPSLMTVPAGVPVTFVVTNTGTAEHEFVVGDEGVQAEHEEAMEGGHDMAGEDNALAVPPGETLELTMTFDEPGEILAGCHVTGHYPAGMKATIAIEG